MEDAVGRVYGLLSGKEVRSLLPARSVGHLRAKERKGMHVPPHIQNSQLLNLFGGSREKYGLLLA